MERLSNPEFVDCITGIQSGGKIPPSLDVDDRENLELVEKFHRYRNMSPMEIFGSMQRQTEVWEIMRALEKLRPVEKQTIYTYLASGYPIDVVARMTYRTVHHSVNSLRSGLTNLRGFIARGISGTGGLPAAR